MSANGNKPRFGAITNRTVRYLTTLFKTLNDNIIITVLNSDKKITFVWNTYLKTGL
jgi:hypothetical protein